MYLQVGGAQLEFGPGRLRGSCGVRVARQSVDSQLSLLTGPPRRSDRCPRRSRGSEVLVYDVLQTCAGVGRHIRPARSVVAGVAATPGRRGAVSNPGAGWV